MGKLSRGLQLRLANSGSASLHFGCSLRIPGIPAWDTNGFVWHLCGWVERIPRGSRQYDGLETGLGEGYGRHLGTQAHRVGRAMPPLTQGAASPPPPGPQQGRAGAPSLDSDHDLGQNIPDLGELWGTTLSNRIYEGRLPEVPGVLRIVRGYLLTEAMTCNPIVNCKPQTSQCAGFAMHACHAMLPPCPLHSNVSHAGECSGSQENLSARVGICASVSQRRASCASRCTQICSQPTLTNIRGGRGVHSSRIRGLRKRFCCCNALQYMHASGFCFQ